ncbi:MAG: LCP family protein [Clostridiales bacterium]|nr:LCP family protein [Clostridiales bacterium]
MSVRLRRIVVFLFLLLVFSCALANETGQIHHYLLLGEDGYAQRVTDDARTDTIVLLSLDEPHNRVIVTSIMRDSGIVNPRGNETKINLLYKYFGFEGISECIGRELGIDIEGCVLVNFEHVKPVIDALGGVDLRIDINEYLSIRKILLGKDPNMPKGPGLVHMTGRIALAYMRDRQSGSGDFSRTERQRKVVSQLVEKCRKLSLRQLIAIYNQVSSGMKMSLTTPQLLSAFRCGYELLANDADYVEYRVPQDGTYSYTTIGSASTLNVRWKANRERFHELLGAEE